MAGRIRVYIATSLDGFIAGPDDDLDWLNAASEHVVEGPEALGFGDFMAQVGAMLMGRRTYDVVLGFSEWLYGEVPILVATNRPLEPIRPTVRAVAGSMDALLDQALEVAGDKDVYLDGGALIRQAVELERVDEYVITVAPVVLGRGIPLFAGVTAQRQLELVRHVDYGSMVQLVLRPKR